ncbi:hypothetical protein BJX68DRAFT_267568 [Aspergillus pseudodeflectus]|uniref:Uncharacterized protein n=1 Tax=Aspergillus pseudodeflectus TaxID=176178 RepID=A0ABR4KBS8_9EURO
MTSIKSHHNRYHHNRYHHNHHPYYTHHDHDKLNPAPKPSPKPSNPTKRSHPRPRSRTTTNPPTPHPASKRNSAPSENNTKRCFTWLLTPSGTMHWAKNRSSFRTYQRAPTKIAGRRVLGVGTVELKVRRGPSPDEDRMNTLVLRDVLHVPGAKYNGICLGRYCETTGDRVEVCGGDCSADGDVRGKEEVRVFSEGESSSGSASEGEIDEDGDDLHGHGHNHRHGEALWYGEGYHGCPRVVLWGDPHGSEDLDNNVEGNVDVPGVDASAEELDTLFTRVKERSLV